MFLSKSGGVTLVSTAILLVGALTAPAFSAVTSRPGTHATLEIPRRAPLLTSRESIISQLGSNQYISSSQDVSNGDQNPYGLAYVPRDSGILHKGDLLVCNFNDSYNIQGLGSTIEYIRPSESHPTAHRYMQDGRITGCEALSITSDDTFLVGATYANLVWKLLPNRSFSGGVSLEPSTNWSFPWGIAYTGLPGAEGFEVQQDGTMWRIDFTGSGYAYYRIGYGFPVNHGVAPTTLAISGISYDSTRHILYLVEGYENAIVAISHPESIPSDGFHWTSSGFSGPYASRARIFAEGGHINAPISSAVLYNGDVVLENTGDNYLLEYSSNGTYLGRKMLDSGPPGALFGIVAIGTAVTNESIYFNDDNENSLRCLSM